jgi:hypothetical protein
MFEPLLGILTRGYVAGEAGRGAKFRAAIDSPRGCQESDGTLFEPLPVCRWCRACQRLPEAGAAVEIAGFGKT